MDKSKLYKLIETFASKDIETSVISSKENQTAEDLENLINKYPYFQTARLLYTKKLQNNNSILFSQELSKTALLCADRKKLFYLIQPDNFEEFLNIYENEDDNPDRTEDLLNSYFKTFGEKTESTLSDNIAAPTDYFAYLESLGEEQDENQSDEHHFQHQDIIDAFIETPISRKDFKSGESGKLSAMKPESSSKSSEVESSDGDSEFLTETLAKIYIKQKKYDKALTIIKRLSLNFPKNSAYFADQIRFLEHLIINDKNK